MKFIPKAKQVFAYTKKFVFAHKFISAASLVVLLGLGWFGVSMATRATAETRYVLGTVEKGTVISSISASGQVSASRQIDLKSEVSGTVTYVAVKAGQTVAKGALIAQIDSSDAQKTLRDAKNNLETAQLALEKLQKPAEGLTLTQAQNAVTNAQDALAKTYVDSESDIVDAFLALPDIMSALQDIVIGTTASHGSQWNIDYYRDAITAYDNNGLAYRDDAYRTYQTAKDSYDKALADYKLMGMSPDNATIEKMAIETNDMLKNVSGAVKSVNSFLQVYKNILTTHSQVVPSVPSAALTTLASQITTISSKLSALTSDTTSIKSGKQSIIEKQQSLADLTDGADPLDVRSDQLTIQQRQDAVLDAQEALAKYSVRAPFAGTIASVDVYVGDEAGSSALASLITPQQIATLSLNEVDAAKISVGNKATLTFDAIEDLTLTGTVAEVDAVGTVSQGVVSYAVQIAFDSQDARIKSGMTVNAAIQTATKQDVLTVPSSAVKTQNGVSYVQVFEPALTQTGGTQGVISKTLPTRIDVTVGISDDTIIEIISGLTEGQQIVTRTTSGAATKTTTTPTGGGGGMGAPTTIRL